MIFKNPNIIIFQLYSKQNYSQNIVKIYLQIVLFNFDKI